MPKKKYYFIGGSATVASEESFDTLEEAEAALEKGKFHVYLLDGDNLEIMEAETD